MKNKKCNLFFVSIFASTILLTGCAVDSSSDKKTTLEDTNIIPNESSTVALNEDRKNQTDKGDLNGSPFYSLKSSFSFATPFGLGKEGHYSPYLLTYANKILYSLHLLSSNDHVHSHSLHDIEAPLLKELINKIDDINKGMHIGPLNNDYFLGIEVINNFSEVKIKDVSTISEAWFFIKDEQIIILLKDSEEWAGFEIKEATLNNMWKEELKTLLHFTDKVHNLSWEVTEGLNNLEVVTTEDVKQTSLLLEQAKSKVSEYLEQDESISEFTIHTFKNYEEKGGKKLYTMEYSIKPTNPDNFVLTGSMREGEDGWIIVFHFVTFENNGELKFTTSP